MKSWIKFGVIIALLWLLIALLTTPPEIYCRVQCKNNLNQIALALHNYHDVYSTFPPAFVPDESGYPAHSWRVLILPYLDSYGDNPRAIYDRYRFDEPWDGPHNRTLHELIPSVYCCPTFQHCDHESDHTKQLTNYVVIDAPRSIFALGHATAIPEITDGASNTILVAEVRRHAVHWLEPEDVSAHELLSDLRFAAEGNDCSHYGLQCAFADGSTQNLPATIDADLFYGLVTKDGSEELGEF